MCVKRSFKCCLSCLIVCIVLLLSVLITTLVLINQTPKKLGFENKNLFQDTSLSDLGLENVKIKDIAKGIVNLRKFEESKVVKNPYNTNTESQNVKSNLKNSNLDKDTINLSQVVLTKVVYDKSYFVSYKDTTLAFIINTALETMSESAKDFANLPKILVKELSITNEKSPQIKIVLSCPYFEFDASNDTRIIGNYLKTPLFSLNFGITVSSEGVVSLSSIDSEKHFSYVVNEGDKMITTVVEHMISSNFKGGVSALSDKLIDCIITVLNNLGKVASVKNTESGSIFAETPDFGNKGVSNGAISFVTHTN